MEIQKLLREMYADYTKIYTDGSKTKELKRTAAAMVIPEQQTQIGARLPDDCSIYTAEFWAINQSLKWIQTQTHLKHVIITDSLSVLNSIKTGSTKSRENMLEETMLLLKELEGKQHTIEFLWVPSHINLIGNEKADLAAKRNLLNSDIYPLAYSIQERYSQVKQRINQKWQQIWNTSNKGRHLFQLQNEITRKTNALKDMEVIDVRTINRLMTGKTLLKDSFGKYLKDQRNHNNNCPYCPVPETLDHIFNTCPRYQTQRSNLREYLKRIGSPTTYPELLDRKQNVNLEATYKSIISYLKQINKYGKI